MIWNLVATVFAGLGAAGIALILRLLSGKKLPKWIIPVFAGLGMLAYQIYTEYTWYEFKRSQLPAGAEVVATETDSMIWRPWTYLKPMTVAFTVVDTGSVSDQMVEGDRVVEFVRYRFEKAYVDQVQPHRQLLNCASREMVELNEEAQPQLNSLQTLSKVDALYQHLCR
ncbi:hypothetical protein [Marinobacterium weihaiense]|uniref:Uncharacterized protein n=1 Tax=Marinobacterium weihaiense TaxID=2851016 RepID=A0ABS6MCK0_9GAMM|nr:hypothetical protein [Marinobacterium weihaiense]MBV0934033.1 hypothetical protein [Marinobacterium weihaiense]